MHQFFQKKTGISPFLAFANEGSFIGAGKLLSKGSSFSGALFMGQHPDLIFSPNHSNTTNGLLLEYQTLFDEKEISIQVGAMNEDRSMLGTSFNGAYGHLDDSLTYFSGVSSSFNLLNFKVLASYYYGITDPNLLEQEETEKGGARQRERNRRGNEPEKKRRKKTKQGSKTLERKRPTKPERKQETEAGEEEPRDRSKD